MNDARHPGLHWKDFEKLARLTAFDEAPAHLRLYAFSQDRHANPAQLDPPRRDTAVALITATSAAVVILAEERFTPEAARDWAESLRANGHAIAKWLRAPLDLVREFYARDAQRRKIAAEAASSATEGAKQLVHLLTTAMDRGASDIDIVVDEDAPRTSIRLRIHGSWIDHWVDRNAFGLDLMRAAFSAIKLDERVRGKVAWSPRADLAGVARFPHLRDLQLRLQQMVERSGVGLSMRLLSYEGLAERYRGLADLGYVPAQARELTRALGRSTGLVLIVGATGSGKTTTLNLAVATSPKFAERKWVSIEDPPEIDTPGIFQIPVATQGAFGAVEQGSDPFAEAMRRVLRFTPDGVIAGEIRDRESAHLAVQMALTGHVVAASLHASDAFLALARLTGRDLGVDPAVLQEPGVLSLVVAQRLIPRLCSCCLTFTNWRRSASLDDQHLVQSTLTTVGADPGSIRFHNAEGCEACNSGRPGYAGRAVCAQVVAFDGPLLETWRQSGIEAARQAWRQRRAANAAADDTTGRSIADQAVLRMKRGECDPRDVARILDTPEISCQALQRGPQDLRSKHG